MNEGVNYINHLKKNIKELSAKRDELKSHASCSFSIHKNNTTVGVEISTKEEGVPLSKLLEQLLKEGLDVVSCFSIQVNGRLLHSMQCEVYTVTDYILLTFFFNLSKLLYKIF